MTIKTYLQPVKEYAAKHHTWIIGILVALLAIAIPSTLTLLQQNGYFDKTTTAYYYVADYKGSQDDAPNLKVADCWIQSLSSVRSDAYRCVSDNSIMDPCFVDPVNFSVVACAAMTPYEDAEYFKVNSEGLPNLRGQDVPADKSKPWFIKLDDGTECRFITGASALVADMRMDYGCGEKGDTQYLLLPINRDNPVWQVSCYKDSRLEPCKIKEAWY